MATGLTTTVVGNLTADPELKYTSSNLAVVSFTVAHTPRKYDSATSTWTDLETMWIKVTAWREFAESIASTLKKGNRVIASGSLIQESYLGKDGETKVSLKLDLADIGVAVPKSSKSGGQSTVANSGWASPPSGLSISIDESGVDTGNAPF
jgi:single-strand DNA-binding protein